MANSLESQELTETAGIIIEINDTGMGIEEKDLPHIFHYPSPRGQYQSDQCHRMGSAFRVILPCGLS